MRWQPGQWDSCKAEPKEQGERGLSKHWGEGGGYLQRQDEWQLFSYPPLVLLNIILRTFASMVITEGGVSNFISLPCNSLVLETRLYWAQKLVHPRPCLVSYKGWRWSWLQTLNSDLNAFGPGPSSWGWPLTATVLIKSLSPWFNFVIFMFSKNVFLLGFPTH